MIATQTINAVRSVAYYEREVPGFENQPGIAGACKGQLGIDIIINAGMAWRCAPTMAIGAAAAETYLANLNL